MSGVNKVASIISLVFVLLFAFMFIGTAINIPFPMNIMFILVPLLIVVVTIRAIIRSLRTEPVGGPSAGNDGEGYHDDPPARDGQSGISDDPYSSDRYYGIGPTRVGARFCPTCGEPLEEGDVFCSRCGRKL